MQMEMLKIINLKLKKFMEVSSPSKILHSIKVDECKEKHSQSHNTP